MSVLRAALLATSLFCVPALANAACPGTPSSCPSPTYNNLRVGGTATFDGSLTGAGLNALFSSPAAIGSVTPNAGTFSTLSTTGQTTFGSVQWIYATLPAFPAAIDSALNSAITQCSALGAKLILPSGVFVITNRVTSIISNCDIEGAGVHGAWVGFAKPGTFIELTGHAGSVTPALPPVFVLGKSAKISGISFYWPSQTGAVLYPALFGDGGPSYCCVSNILFDNVSIINAYDAIAQTDGTASWGGVKFINSNIFAANDQYRIYNGGGAFYFSNVEASPGVWLTLCGSCNGPVGLAASTSKFFHAMPTSGTINIYATGLSVIGARYGFYLENNADVSETQVNATWDAVGTILDTSAGGTWRAGNTFTGINAACYITVTTWTGGPQAVGEPCFNMGTVGELNLNGFLSNGVQGDLVATAGANVTVQNSVSVNVGSNTLIDILDYYHLRITAASGSPQFRIQGNRLGGINANAKVHGVTTTGAGTPGVIMIQDNTFQFLNDDVNVRFPQGALINGNSSFATNAAGGLKSFNQIGTNAIYHYGNSWDTPPTVTLSGSCGSGCAVAAGGTPNSGTINLGSGTVTSAAFVLPINLYGRCVVQSDAAVAIGVVQTGSPATVTSSFTNIGGFHLFYNCPGQ